MFINSFVEKKRFRMRQVGHLRNMRLFWQAVEIAHNFYLFGFFFSPKQKQI